MSPWKERLRAAGIHLLISLAIAALAAALVFGLWYPQPYPELSGGRELFLLVVSVDVVMGPLITLAIFNRKKPWKELRRDLAIVGLLQLAALGYGLWTVAVARPVHLVFEYNRFRVVHAIEVPEELIAQAPPGITPLPFTGPDVLSLRPFKDSKEQFDSTMAAVAGVSLSARPDLWQPYATARDDGAERRPSRCWRCASALPPAPPRSTPRWPPPAAGRHAGVCSAGGPQDLLDRAARSR